MPVPQPRNFDSLVWSGAQAGVICSISQTLKTRSRGLELQPYIYWTQLRLLSTQGKGTGLTFTLEEEQQMSSSRPHCWVSCPGQHYSLIFPWAGNGPVKVLKWVRKRPWSLQTHSALRISRTFTLLPNHVVHIAQRLRHRLSNWAALLWGIAIGLVRWFSLCLISGPLYTL